MEGVYTVNLHVRCSVLSYLLGGVSLHWALGSTTTTRPAFAYIISVSGFNGAFGKLGRRSTAVFLLFFSFLLITLSLQLTKSV